MKKLIPVILIMTIALQSLATERKAVILNEPRRIQQADSTQKEIIISIPRLERELREVKDELRETKESIKSIDSTLKTFLVITVVSISISVVVILFSALTKDKNISNTEN